MYMANARDLRHLTQEIPTCWSFFALGNAKVISFALGDSKLPNANGFASQWNIGFTVGGRSITDVRVCN